MMALINNTLKTLANDALSRRCFHAGACMIFISMLSGCGGTKYTDPPVLPVAPVSGTVKFGAQVPAGALVTFVPVSRTEEGIASQGTVRADGTFKISTYGKEDGAPLGDYVVLLQWNKPIGGEDGNAGGVNVFPRNYSNPTQSPIKVTVKEGTNEIPIVIPRGV